MDMNSKTPGRRSVGAPIVVQKYGGSSVGDLEKIARVAERIVATVREGKRVVAVLSAMRGQTDYLLGQAKMLAADPHPRELDMLLSTGERVSTALLAIAVHRLGVPAISFTGSQSGIITNTRHNRARIIEVRPFRLLDELDAGKVVIVAGYQGVSYAREITTLGRGGTDTTAVALAAALGAEHCEILSDVDGVHTADPRIVPGARRIPELGYEEMIALARGGAKVLNQDCVAYAARHGVAIFAKAAFGLRDDTGTVIRANPAREFGPVMAITRRRRAAAIRLESGHDPAPLLRQMATLGAYPTLAWGGGADAFWALVPLDDAHRLGALVTRLDEALGGAARLVIDRGTVTIVGHGLGEEPRVVQAALAVGRELTPEPAPLHLSSLALTLVLPEARVDDAVRRLHRALLGQEAV